jgi:hypothetical protein
MFIDIPHDAIPDGAGTPTEGALRIAAPRCLRVR